MVSSEFWNKYLLLFNFVVANFVMVNSVTVNSLVVYKVPMLRKSVRTCNNVMVDAT